MHESEHGDAVSGRRGAGRGAQSPRPSTRAEEVDELERAQRIANACVKPEDIDWLSKGFNAFLASGGRLPLERCLKLPTNERALRRALRDRWLRHAWAHLDDEPSPWRRSELLAAEIRRFESRKWARWSTLDQPPDGSSSLEAALFEAFRAHGRVPATAMQLHNIAGFKSTKERPDGPLRAPETV
ncbi:hypothetical protein V4F39_21710 [Aquincola sp. MAHUQ-54]|uniref:Uncharacterized protein n=1 Tax=Aquincola agrisoli TaxID=3119538 RepID=A0AAW9QK76_9BURK